MKTMTIQFKRKDKCKIIIGQGALSDLETNLVPFLMERDAILLTNPLVRGLYGDQIARDLSNQGITVHVIEIPDGERNKCLSMAEKIYDRLLQLKANRSTVLITLGGGVIGDLGGFVAATFMRGIPFIHIPTTLLAQVDSSIGGKVAVNLPNAKNIVGSFYQPIAVLTDPALLQSLPFEHFTNGLVEAIKIAIISSPSFFQWLNKNINLILQKNKQILDLFVNEAIQLKINIILDDPWEKNQRKFLNFGHTIGHALEVRSNYQGLSHGEAVALGMLIETKIARNRGICSEKLEEKIKQIVFSFLPRCLSASRMQGSMYTCFQDMDHNQFWDTLALDKKNQKGRMVFILPESLGKAHLIHNIKKAEVIKSLEEIKGDKELRLC